MPSSPADIGDSGSTAPEVPTRALSGAPQTRTEAPAEARPPPAPVRGRLVGRYVLVDLLGQGGMGTVCSAYDPELSREVAIKLVELSGGPARGPALDGAGSPSPDSDATRSRVLREARAMAQLSHPNVVAIYDVGSHDGQVFIAMELLRGRTLRDWTREARRSWRQSLEVFLAAGRGLAAAHARGLVHRDFKPTNVIVANDGRVCVIDFGLARAATEADRAERSDASSPAPALDPSPLAAPLTELGTVLGTPRYMAPEQFRGQPADAQSDQFSFCVALFEALYGRTPYGDTAALATNTGKSLELPAEPKVPSWVKLGLLRGLALSPRQRFADMGALLEALSSDPRAPRRRRFVVAGTLFFAVGVAATAWSWAQRRHGEVCRGADVMLSDVWDDAVRTQARRAFLDTGRPQALETWGVVERALSDFSARWVRSRTEACAATRLRGELSEEVMTSRLACLDLVLEELRTTTRLLRRAGPSLLEHAPQAAHALSSARCDDIGAVLRQSRRQPQDAASRKSEQALRVRLSEARALDAAGQSSEGLSIARQVVAEARKFELRGLEADGLQLRGWMENQGGDFDGAAKTLEESVYVAEAVGADETFCLATAQLAFVRGDRMRDFVAGEQWAHLAEAKLERMLGASPLATAKSSIVGAQLNEPLALALNNRGLLLLRQDRPADAMPYFAGGGVSGRGFSAPTTPRSPNFWLTWVSPINSKGQTRPRKKRIDAG